MIHLKISKSISVFEFQLKLTVNSLTILVIDKCRNVVCSIRGISLEICDFALDSVRDLERQGSVETVSTHVTDIDSQFEAYEDLFREACHLLLFEHFVHLNQKPRL